METTYRTDDARVVSMKVPDDAWEYSDVDKFTFDTEECSMEVAGELYQYSEQTYFGSIDDKKDRYAGTPVIRTNLRYAE